MGDDEVLREFQRRYGPGGDGATPGAAPLKPARGGGAPPPSRPAAGPGPGDAAAWSDFLADFADRGGPPAPPPPEPPAAPPPKPPRPRDPDAFDRQVDLHGLTRREASALLDRRLLEARLLGLETLLVITGRGLHGSGGGILRGWLPEWAARQAEGHPLRCDPAPASLGGPGAFLLWV